MSGMNELYRDVVAQAGATAITYIGLVDADGIEIAGGDPPYERKKAYWTAPDDGKIQLVADLEFDVPAGSVVKGWRGFSALTEGTDYGGADVRLRTFATQGKFILFAADTWIKHSNPSSVRWW